MKQIRCGVVGLGAMGKNHSRVLLETQGVEFVGAADPVVAKHPTGWRFPVFSSVEELVREGIDAAVVSVPTNLHAEVGRQLAELGVACLIEKPIAHTVPQATELVEAFRRNGVLASIGHVERFNPAIRELRTFLKAGKLGQIFQVQTRRQGPFPGRIADVGCLKDLATHDIDTTQWLSESSYSRISAFSSQRVGRGFEDLVIASGELQSGVLVNHVVNWLTPFKERTTVVTGELGSLVADTLTGDLTFFASDGSSVDWEAVRVFRGVSEGHSIRFSFEKREPLKSELETFISAVRGNDEPTLATLEDGLRVLEVAEVFLMSSESKSSVAL